MSSIVSDSVAGLGRGEGPVDERPLTDQERQTVARLLSDPFAFPQTFKAWLIAFLESSDLTLPISSISGLGSTLGIGGGGNTSFIKGLLPAGTILGWGSGRIPSGCLRCDGVAYSRSAYSSLFTEIGTTWGAGDGSTSFNVPDLRRRFPIGAGDSGYGLTSSENRAESARAPDHHHYFSGYGGFSGRTDGVGDHSHSYTRQNIINQPIYNSADAGRSVPAEYYGDSTGGAGGHDHGFSGGISVDGDTTGGWDQDHGAFIAVHFIIVS